MFHLACTRFNTSTYDENMTYRQNNNINVIYGVTIKIRDIYSLGSSIFVVEMNNETNKIEGIGLIKNSLMSEKKHKIYINNKEYNRYVYGGKYWMSRTQILDFDKEIVEILEIVLFKGRSHLKRMTGITIIREKLFMNWDYNLNVLKAKIKRLFLNQFTDHS